MRALTLALSNARAYARARTKYSFYLEARGCEYSTIVMYSWPPMVSKISVSYLVQSSWIW